MDNFDLRLAVATGGYTAEVLDSPAGQTARPAVAGCDMAACSPVAEYLSQHDMEAAGRALWQCAFPAPVVELWRASLAALGPDGALRLRLIVDAAELAALPWELLYDETLGRFPALDGRTPLVRFTRLPFAAAPWPQDRPLRLLFTGASPEGLPPINVAAEWDGIRGGLAATVKAGHLALDAITEGLTLSRLVGALPAGVDIWHFAGHGDAGMLTLSDRYNQAAEAEAGTVGRLLAGEGVRLAVLNACRLATGDEEATSVAEALVRAGIPAVVSMQRDMPEDAAQAFAAGFYTALAGGQGGDPAPGGTVDRAVTAGRKAVLASGGIPGTCWWLPALFMRTPDGMLWRREAEMGGGERKSEGYRRGKGRKITVHGDRIETAGPVATRGGAISTGGGVAVSGSGNVVNTGSVGRDFIAYSSYVAGSGDRESFIALLDQIREGLVALESDQLPPAGQADALEEVDEAAELARREPPRGERIILALQSLNAILKEAKEPAALGPLVAKAIEMARVLF